MNWVQIRPLVANWPGGGTPPVFEIAADDNGDAVIELAWDPEALLAPADYADTPLRYYSTDVDFNVTVRKSDGSTLPVSVSAQQIQLNGNRALWTMPQPLWDGYVAETLKTLSTPSTTTFQANIYYRVRAQATGAANALIWPADPVLQGAAASTAPHIGILLLSATPASQVAPDTAAVQAMGTLNGVALGDVLIQLWSNLPEQDPDAQALVQVFSHPTFQGITDEDVRGKILKLWLFAGPNSRSRIPALLDRQTVVGSQVTQPVITKLDYKGAKSLADNLLGLLDVLPHPDIVGLTTKEQLLDDVITEILDPNGQMNQGQASTCTTTSIQTLLITINPSEYARLQQGLLSAAGTVQLANGANAVVPPAIFQVARYSATPPFSVRTNSELAFQATMLKYAMDTRFPTYAPNADPNAANGINTVFRATVNNGLFSGEMKRVLNALFNVNFTIHSVQQSDASWPAIATIQTRQPALRDELVQDLPAKQQQLILVLYWGLPLTDPKTGTHAVVALRHDGGRVYFKNPQYPGSAPTQGITQGSDSTTAGGVVHHLPPRRFDDPSDAVESISDTDLASWIAWYYVPDEALI